MGQSDRLIQQLVGVRGNPEEPLFELAHLNRRAAAPAPAIDHLFVGEDSVAARAPVHRRAPAVCEPPLEHPDEQPLIPLVVLGIARGELTFPGVADAEPLELSFHVRDVAARRYLRMNAALDSSVLGRKAERIPSKWMQDVVAPHALGPATTSPMM